MRTKPGFTTILLLFTLLITSFSTYSPFSFQQKQDPLKDEEAANLLKKVSDKYKGYKNISANFMLQIQRPKLKPEEDDRKYTDTMTGLVVLQGPKFKVVVIEQQIICDGKNIWTYMPADKEVQVNYFEETDDIFSPSKIFTLYSNAYIYQIKEKKNVGGKAVTVVEMSPVNKKTSYFKIDVSIEDATLQIIESKIYEKNGSRYVYKLTKQTPNISTNDDSFIFDARKYPGVKMVDLR